MDEFYEEHVTWVQREGRFEIKPYTNPFFRRGISKLYPPKQITIQKAEELHLDKGVHVQLAVMGYWYTNIHNSSIIA